MFIPQRLNSQLARPLRSVSEGGSFTNSEVAELLAGQARRPRREQAVVEHHEMSERWREILQQLTSELERQTVTGLEKNYRHVRIGLICSVLLKSMVFLFYPSLFLSLCFISSFVSFFLSFYMLDFVGDFSIIVMFRLPCLLSLYLCLIREMGSRARGSHPFF